MNFSMTSQSYTFSDTEYQRTNVIVVLSQLEEPGIKFFVGSTPRPPCSLRSSPGFPLAPQVKKCISVFVVVCSFQIIIVFDYDMLTCLVLVLKWSLQFFLVIWYGLR